MGYVSVTGSVYCVYVSGGGGGGGREREWERQEGGKKRNTMSAWMRAWQRDSVGCSGPR